MPPRRQAPSGQMTLFKPTKDAVKQNSRWVATATATVEQLIAATSRAPDDHYGQQTDTQRPLHKNHCLTLANYYKDNSNWIIAPFVFTSESDDFTIKDGAFEGLSGQFNILDGQHRVQALHIVNDELNNSPDTSDKQKLRDLLGASVVLQFIENKGPQDAAQLFVDLNRGRAVGQAELASLDGRDPIVNIIKEALREVEWADQRTDRGRGRPAASSNEIWTLTSLKTVVKAIEVGIKSSMPKARREYLTSDDGHQESVGKLTGFLNWLPEARPEYANLKDQPNLNVPDERTRHFVYDDRFIVLLADAWSNSTNSGPTPEALATAVGQLNLSRQDAANDLKRLLDLIDGRNNLKAYNRGEYADASVKIREKASRDQR